MNNESPSSWQQNLRFLIELRKRLLTYIITLVVCACVLMPFSNTLFTWLALPLLKSLAGDQHLIATSVVATFTVPLKLSFMVALIVTIPVLLHQIWAFIAPALYNHEQKLVAPILVSSVLLFYIGMSFAYFIVFPMIFGFFVSAAPMGVVLMPDIDEYLSFTFKLFLAFGLTFEIPIITLLLIWTGVTNPTKLIQKRPYIIVGAFTLGMILTPPDVLSQIMLAIPMWLLFELGLWLAILFPRSKDRGGQARNEL